MAKPKKPQQELITEEDLDEDENLDDLNDEEPEEDIEEDDEDEAVEEEPEPEVELPILKKASPARNLAKKPGVPKQMQVAKETLIPGFLDQLKRIKEGVMILNKTPKLVNVGRKLDEAIAWLKSELSSK